MDSTRLKILLFVILSLFVAVYLGVAAATAQLETVAWILGGGIFIGCVLLGKKIWMLLPFMTALNLTLSIPGTPTTLLLAQALFVGFAGLLFLMRRLPFKIAFTELGFWTLLLCLCVAQTYARNPVGLNIFGGASVGARPYAIFAAALVSSVLLSALIIPAKDLRWILRLSILGGLINFAMLAVGYFIPRVGVWYGAVAANAGNTNIQQQGQYGVETASRIGFLGTAGRNLSLWVSSFVSPIRACFHPIWAPLVLLSFTFAAFSGFRNEIGAVGLTYLIAIAYRGGIISVFIASVTLVMGIVLLALVNLLAPLPGNIQRSLSFLPGTWEQSYVDDAEGSTEWRVDMWEEALLTDYWIKNKILGDGLGMTSQELNYIRSFGDGFTGAQSIATSNKLSLQQEFMMATGNYHSGPVSTIRAIGYLGLLVLLLAQIRLAVHAHRQIMRARNTEWFPLTLLIGIPIIWTPIFFTFVFGDFGVAVAGFLMGAAMIRVLENNLPLPTYTKRRISTPQISTPAASS